MAAQGVSITVANGEYKKPKHMDFSWAPPLYENAIGEGRHVKIICIGAGFSGICTAIQFQDNLSNYDLTIYERAEDVGGVWQQNRYPGVACDVPSHAYQFSFCENTQWSAYYAPGAEIQQYLRNVTDRYNLNQYIKLRHRVDAAVWNEKRSKWVLTITNEDTTFRDEADFVIFATGLLSNPLWPTNIPGRDDYKGKMVHSGDWKAAGIEDEEGFTWADKRVAIIGQGASGVQIVPALQKQAKQVLNFGRSQLWLSGGWGSKVLARLQGSYEADGNYFFTDKDKTRFQDSETYRLFRCAIEEDLGSTHELSLRNHPLQEVFADKFSTRTRNKVANKPWIADRIIPDFPVGCKRLTPGPGYLEALCEDNCDLISEKIESFTEKGIRTADGVEYELDVIVCATGYDVTFRPAFPIIGKNGVNMQDLWEREARTYLGMFTAELPNAFNILTTQSAVGSGSLLAAAEQQVAYMTKTIAKCQRDAYKTFAPKKKAVDDFLRYTDNYFARSVLTTNCKSWYKNGADGEAIIRSIWPGSGSHYFAALRHPRWEDFDWEPVEDLDHSMSWLGNGTAPQVNGAQVHLSMREYYKVHTMF